MRPRIWSVYERKFETDAHDGERHYRSPSWDERRHAVYASHCKQHVANDGAYAHDY